MIELVYVSRAQSRFNQQDLREMLSLFRRNNQATHLTGLLLYDGFGTFVQTLEGEEDTVKALYTKIQQDNRHSRVNLLGERIIDKRSFPDWRMGFKNLEHSLINDLEGYSDFLQQPDRPSYLSKHASFAMDLLDYFKNNNKSNLDMELGAC